MLLIFLPCCFCFQRPHPFPSDESGYRRWFTPSTIAATGDSGKVRIEPRLTTKSQCSPLRLRLPYRIR